MDKGFEQAMGGLNLKLEMSAAVVELQVAEYGPHLGLQKEVKLPDAKGQHAYWVRVLRINGNAAWSSPVFVDVE